MADYKVGNLQIVFDTLDETKSSFDSLKKDLSAVTRSLIKLSSIDTAPLVANIKAISKAFSPLLKDIQGASGALADFNSVVQKIGVNNISKAAQEFERMRKETDNTAETLTYSASVVENAWANSGAVSLNKSLTTALREQEQVVLLLGTRVKETVSAFADFDIASQEVNRLSQAWKNLYANTESISGMDEALNELGTEFLRNKAIVDETNEAFKRMAMTEQELVLYDFQQENASRRQRIAYLQLMLATGQAGEKTREYKKELRDLIAEQKEADKIAGKSTRGGLSKLIKQIGRIALYRTIRRGLQLITQTFRESIQAYAQVDDSINDMMSQLTSSTKVISLSLGTLILPILTAITPVVQQLSQGFANMANAINKSMALAQGNATYTKINADALKDYRKQLDKTSGALFDFDKFRALSSKQEDSSIFFSTEQISELDEAESKYSGIYDLVSSIGEVIAQIFSVVGEIFRAATPIINIVAEIASWILKAVGYVLKFVKESGLIEPILYGVLAVLGLIAANKVITWISSGAAKNAIVGLAKAISSKLITALEGANGAFIAWGIAIGAVVAAVKILSNWDEFNRGTKIAITVISGLATALLAAATAAMALHGTLTLGTAIPLITAAIASGVVFIRGLVDIPNYATGGLPDKGTMFIAGEAGAEMVYNMPSGQTGVANVSQIAQAEYQAVLQALKDYGAARGDMPHLKEVSGTRIYEINRNQGLNRGQTTVKV